MVKLAIFCPSTNASDILQSHITALCPEQTVVVSSSTTELKTPHLEIPDSAGLRYFPNVEEKVTSFLKDHSVTHILVEYASKGMEIIDLNERILKLPLSIHFYDEDFGEKLNDQGLVAHYRNLAKSSHSLIVNSYHNHAKLLATGLANDKLTLIPSGISTANARQGDPKREPCHFVSIVDSQNSLSAKMIIAAFQIARTKSSKISLELIVEGDISEELEQHLNYIGLPGAIIIAKNSSKSLIKESFLAASAYVEHPIGEESTSRNLMLASAYELPIISTSNGEVLQIVDEGESGLLCPTFDIQKLANLMQNLSKNPELRLKLGSQGRIRALKDFDQEKSLQQTREAIGLVHKSTSAIQPKKEISENISSEPAKASNFSTSKERLTEALKSLNSGDSKTALKLFNEIIGEEKSNPSLLFGIAVAKIRLGETTDALENLRQLLSEVPTHKKSQLLLQELELKEEAQAKTISSTSNATLEKTPCLEDNESNNQEKALSSVIDQALRELKAGESKQALETLDCIANEKQKDLHYIRAICFAKDSDFDLACEALKLELKNFPENLAAKEMLKELPKNTSENPNAKGGDS